MTNRKMQDAMRRLWVDSRYTSEPDDVEIAEHAYGEGVEKAELGKKFVQKQPVPENNSLEKAEARGGKYIRRVPYTDSKGKRRYRYFYRESAAAREAKVGEEVKLGQRIVKVLHVSEEGHVTIGWDGNRETIAPNQWHDKLAKHYGEAYQKSLEKRARQTINAVLRHVPRALLEDLKAKTDKGRLIELESKVPEVYAKLQKAFQRAGMSPFAAKRVIAKTLERRGWEPEARALVIGTVTQYRAIGTTELIEASERLAAGDRVQAQHVATASELRAPGGDVSNFPVEVKATARAAEKELATLSAMLAKARTDPKMGVEAAAKALASVALQKYEMLVQAFPGIQDKLTEKVRETIPEIGVSVPLRPTTQDGAHTTVFVAGEGGRPKALKARYRLVEAEDLIASHNPDSFARRQDYPEDVQERAYHRDKAEQAKVIRNAQKFDPRFVVNTNPDAVNGPPLVTQDGITLGGNSRVMSMQRVYSQHPEQAKKLRQYLTKHAYEAGLAPDDVAAMRNPILIREVEVEDKSKRNLQFLVRTMNESFTQAMDPRTMQVAMGRKLSENDLKALGQEMGEDQTLSAFLGSKQSERFVNALFRAGIIDDRNVSQYIRKGTRRLNQDGVTLVGRLLVGRMVQNADVLSNTGARMIESVAQSVPYMIQATAHGEGYDLSEDLSVAIDAFNDLQRLVDDGYLRPLDPKMKDREFQQLFNNFQTLPGIGEPHPVLHNDRAAQLLEVLVRKRGPIQMAKAFKAYAKAASHNPENQGGLFGTPQTPTQILGQVVQRAMKGEKEPEAPKEKGPELFAASMKPVKQSFVLQKAREAQRVSGNIDPTVGAETSPAHTRNPGGGTFPNFEPGQPGPKRQPVRKESLGWDPMAVENQSDFPEIDESWIQRHRESYEVHPGAYPPRTQVFQSVDIADRAYVQEPDFHEKAAKENREYLEDQAARNVMRPRNNAEVKE